MLDSEGALVLYSLKTPCLSMEASSGLSFFWGVVGGLRTILSSVLEWLFRKKGWFDP